MLNQNQSGVSFPPIFRYFYKWLDDKIVGHFVSDSPLKEKEAAKRYEQKIDTGYRCKREKGILSR